MFEEVNRRTLRAPLAGDADAGAQHELTTFDHIWLFELLKDGGCEVIGVSIAERSLRQDGKLISAEAHDAAAIADAT